MVLRNGSYPDPLTYRPLVLTGLPHLPTYLLKAIRELSEQLYKKNALTRLLFLSERKLFRLQTSFLRWRHLTFTSTTTTSQAPAPTSIPPPPPDDLFPGSQPSAYDDFDRPPAPRQEPPYTITSSGSGKPVSINPAALQPLWAEFDRSLAHLRKDLIGTLEEVERSLRPTAGWRHDAVVEQFS